MAVTRLKRDRFDEVVEVLCAAFQDYPVMRYIVGDAGASYDSKLTSLVGYFTESRYARDYPVLGVTGPEGRLVGAANVNPPRPVPAPPSLGERYRSLGEELGGDAIERFEAFAGAGSDLSPTEPHFYLGMIGVVPDRQGCGYARLLLEAVHEMSARDPESTGVSLTTELAANVALYEHFGYRVLGRAVTSDGKLESWRMMRGDPTPNSQHISGSD